MRIILSFAVLATLGVAPSVVVAQQTSNESSTVSASMSLPTGGMTMAKVRDSYGNPTLERPAVGDPPITRWEYEGYTVYFEHQLVITSVSDAEIAPKLDQ